MIVRARHCPNVADLTCNVNSILAPSAILDDVLLKLRDSHEQQQRHFDQHQRVGGC
ncbi:MAG: hypothetical protein ACFKPT_14355 [Gloeotrichia echinulata GP01]